MTWHSHICSSFWNRHEWKGCSNFLWIFPPCFFLPVTLFLVSINILEVTVLVVRPNCRSNILCEQISHMISLFVFLMASPIQQVTSIESLHCLAKLRSELGLIAFMYMCIFHGYSSYYDETSNRLQYRFSDFLCRFSHWCIHMYLIW